VGLKIPYFLNLDVNRLYNLRTFRPCFSIAIENNKEKSKDIRRLLRGSEAGQALFSNSYFENLYSPIMVDNNVKYIQ